MPNDAQLIDHAVIATLVEAFADDCDGGLAELFDTFLEHTPPRIRSLTQAMADGDCAQMLNVAHTLKGSCANFGARAIAGKCAVLEETLAKHPGAVDRASLLVAEIGALYLPTELEIRATIAQNVNC